MGLKQIDHKSADYEKMVQLRLAVLRQPLGLSFMAEELARENEDILIGSFDEDELLGCCILSQLDKHTLRLRQMAVHNNQQGKGIGESIMFFSEVLAVDKGFKKIVMHARNTAIGFYEKFGYAVVGEQFTEVNLPHHVMEKNI